MTPEFHKPFLKNLLIIASVTLVTMIFSHYFIHFFISQDIQPHSFTSQKSQFTLETSSSNSK